jgi:hypothetical protein
LLILFDKTFIKAFDQNAQELYEKANNLELMLVRSRLEISKSSPEQVLQEVVDYLFFESYFKAYLFIFFCVSKEIQCLKAELKRKEDLLADTKEKVAQHENFLKSMIN